MSRLARVLVLAGVVAVAGAVAIASQPPQPSTESTAIGSLPSDSAAGGVPENTPAPAGQAPSAKAVDETFAQACAACHGGGGAGGDRGPALVNSPKLRAASDPDIAAVIRNGTLGGMPSFSFDEVELVALVRWIRERNTAVHMQGSAEEVAEGERFFFGNGACAQCHMVRGRGGSNGPDLSSIAVRLTQEEIERVLDDPTSQLGTRRAASCPGWAFCPDLQWSVVNVRLHNGSALRGFARNEGEHDLQLQTFDGRLHLLTNADYVSSTREAASYMPPLRATAEERRALLAYLGTLHEVPLGPLAHRPAPPTPREIDAVTRPAMGEWPSYNGGPSGNRYSPLAQINRSNASRLRPAWIFAPGGTGLETTPVVVDGVMYVTGAQQVCALDARTGRSIWCAPRSSGRAVPAGGVVETPRQRAPTPAVAMPAPFAGARPSAGVASGNGPNRGVAILGSRLYVVSDDAYLICLNRLTGGVMWMVPLTDPEHKGRYYATAAPLIVNDLVVSGISGGDSPTRGSLVAFTAATGELAWRFWTVPKPGEPLAETWVGNAIPNGGAATWMTGSYDPEADILYWGVGNPYPSTDGDERRGANLYASSVVALDPRTGTLRWHYQFTPHDLHDWDATSPLVLVDMPYRGQDRKLLLQANRNGFFYVLDRITGEFLFAKPFVDKMTWAKGIDAEGVPILVPGHEPTEVGTVTCPAVRGATNWFGTSFNPGTGLFYVMAAEDCGLYRKSGRLYGPNPDQRDPGTRVLRALDVSTGEIGWEKALTGSNEANYSGVLSTAGGVVFHGETGGGFAAVDATTGKTLQTFPANDAWRATPMTYMIDGRQYVAVAAGSNIIAFTLDANRHTSE